MPLALDIVYNGMLQFKIKWWLSRIPKILLDKEMEMKSMTSRVALIVLVVALGSALVFWGCGKKSTTSPTVSGGKLFIWSLPDSASVTLDGASQSGRTPLTLQNVSAAQHVVRCTKGNFYAVDTVVVHSGRSTPDTAFCWIPGKVNITSNPANAFVHFVGRHSPIDTVVSTGLWIVHSDTFAVSCSTSTAGYFKAVDTFRIWADSTAKNYVLPPMASQTQVWYHPIGGAWQQGTSFGNVDSVRAEIYLADSIGANGIIVQIQLKYNGSIVATVSDTLNYTRGFYVIWYSTSGRLPVGSYSQPTTWLVSPHDFLLAEPAWSVTSYFLGGPVGRGYFRAIVRPLRAGRRY